jgi:integrase
LTGKAYAYSILEFLRYLKSKSIHYKEVQSSCIIEEYIKFALFGKDDVSEIKGSLSINSVKNRISIIKTFYEWLEDNREVEANPVNYGRTGKLSKKHSKHKFLYGQVWEFDYQKSVSTFLRHRKEQNHVRWYEKNEIESIINHLPTMRDKIVFKISIETGCRIGEILGLRLSNFNDREATILIRKNQNAENEARAKTAERDLYISRTLADEFCDYIRGERFDADVDQCDYLFINHKGPSKGKAMRTRNFLDILKKSGEKAGISADKIRTHSGRSTHAQHLLDALHEGKISQVYILQQMGWSNIETMKSYIRSYNEKSRVKLARSIVDEVIDLPKIEKMERVKNEQ